MTNTRTDLDIKLLERALSSRVVGRRIFHHDLLGSTMDEARRLAEEDAEEGAVVIAEEQTAGRGRFNRAWISPRGQNLSFSVLLRPAQAQMPFVNMAATLAVSRTVARVTGLSPAIKWPNDVRVGGRKISGILIEAAIEAGHVATLASGATLQNHVATPGGEATLQNQVSHAIVGIGLNVNFDPSLFPEIADIATSLFRETGRPHRRTQVLQHLLEEFDALYSAVRAGRSLTAEWSAQLETLGRSVRLAWQDNIVEGKAEAVDDQGNLILTLPDGSKFTALAGEVTLQV